MIPISFLLLLLLAQPGETSPADRSAEIDELTALIAGGSDDALASFSFREDLLCELLSSQEPFKGLLGRISQEATYFVDISDEELEEISDRELKAELRALSSPDDLYLRRRALVGEAAAYLLTAVLSKDYDHAFSAELVLKDGAALSATQVHERLVRVHRSFCLREPLQLSEDSFEKALDDQGLRHFQGS